MDCTQFDDLESLFAVIELFDQDDRQLLSAADSSNLQSQRSALQQRAWDLTSRQQNRGLPDRRVFRQVPSQVNTYSTVFTCNACTESFPTARLLTLNCGHRYCRDCTQHMFTASLSGTHPQCCQEQITLSVARHFLTADLIRRLEVRELEAHTSNKVYCSNVDCRRFIPPNNVDPEEAYCTSCGTATCSRCKAAIHSGKCLEDPHLQGLLDLAHEEGWQLCPKCGRVFELEDGCNHVTCPPPCGTKFCFNCGRVRGTCNCELFQRDPRPARRAQTVSLPPGADPLIARPVQHFGGSQPASRPLSFNPFAASPLQHNDGFLPATRAQPNPFGAIPVQHVGGLQTSAFNRDSNSIISSVGRAGDTHLPYRHQHWDPSQFASVCHNVYCRGNRLVNDIRVCRECGDRQCGHCGSLAVW